MLVRRVTMYAKSWAEIYTIREYWLVWHDLSPLCDSVAQMNHWIDTYYPECGIAD